jgi:LysM repeat protein
MEKALFPMKYLNISQGINGSYSHKGTMKIDITGSGTGIDNAYAPYTGVIKKIDTKDANQVWFESLNPVKYADGTEDYMTIIFAHDNDVSNLYVGKVINQGDIFYQEGTAGNATGNHIQLDVGKGKYVDNGWYQNDVGQWVIYNEIDPTKALWVKNDTVIINNGGYTWKVTNTNTYQETTKDNTSNVYYTIKAGDTLSGIANKYDIGWQELYNANKTVIGPNASIIKIGQELLIPNTIYYIVTKGDNLYRIAERFNTTWNQIYADNKDIIGSNPSNLRVGQKLIIKT